MITGTKKKRILFYSHDTFGLGHIRRTQKIANVLSKDGNTILIACASPVARMFTSLPGIEYLNLPGYEKLRTGEYKPRGLDLPIEDFVNLRSSLLLSTIRSFQPDIMIIDKEPLGVKRELLPGLDFLRTSKKKAKVICGFRDILDETPAVHKEWKNRDTVRALEDFFDHIFIYGDKKIFDFGKEYELPFSIQQKLDYTGYIQPDANPELETPVFSFSNDLPVVTFTLGGGGDGWEYLQIFLEMLESGVTRNKFNSIILTGPFASPDLVYRAKLLSQRRSDIHCFEFVANTESLFRRSQLVISMGGYNSSCELASLRKYPLILPRVVPRKEQLIRAKVFQSQSLCDYLHPEHLSPEALKEKILAMLETKSIETPPEFHTPGLLNIKRLIDKTVSA